MHKKIFVVLLLLIGVNKMKAQDTTQVVLGAKHALRSAILNEDHNSVPIIAFHNGISEIFEGFVITYRDVENKEELTQHFYALSERLSWDYSPPQYLVTQLGYSMLQSGNDKDKFNALEFFILNAETYPKSSKSFDGLAEAHETLGDTQKAIEYSKSLLN